MGSRIKQAREAKELSQEALGKLVGVGKGMVSATETGRFMPSAPVLIKMGVELGTGVDELAYGPEHTFKQVTLPGFGLDERINALPAALKEYMVQKLKELELLSRSIPLDYLAPPTGANYRQFEAMLDALSKRLPPE